MKDKKIFYLVEEDFQHVAQEELGRHLTSDELIRVQEAALERINWYDAIADAIISEQLQ